MQITKDITFKDITVKKYIPLIEKHLLTTKIIDSSIKIDANNIYSIDYFYKYFITQLSLLSNYTDLNFSEEAINDFDCLAELGLVEDIIEQIPDSEINFIVNLVDSELDQMVKINNSLENIVASKLEKLIQKIPDEKGIKSIIKEAKKQINGLKPENLEILKNVVSKQGGLN